MLVVLLTDLAVLVHTSNSSAYISSPLGQKWCAHRGFLRLGIMDRFSPRHRAYEGNLFYLGPTNQRRSKSNAILPPLGGVPRRSRLYLAARVLKHGR